LKIFFGPGRTQPTHFGLGSEQWRWCNEEEEEEKEGRGADHLAWRWWLAGRGGRPEAADGNGGRVSGWWQLSILFSLFSFSLLLSILCPFPLLFFCFCDSNCCFSRCWWWRWWPNVAADGGSRRRLLLFSPLFLLFLCLSLFLLLLLFLMVQGLLTMTGRTAAASNGSGVALVVAMWTTAGGSSPFSPSSFSLPRLGNGTDGATVVLLVCAEVKASSSSRVLHAGGGEWWEAVQVAVVMENGSGSHL